MQLLTVACNQCGAPLDVPPETSFVTCRHCGAALAVHRNESVAYTRRLDRLDRRTDQLTEWIAEREHQEALDKAHHAYHQALKTIDAHWAYTCGPQARVSGSLLLIIAFTMTPIGLEFALLSPKHFSLGCWLLFGGIALTIVQWFRGRAYRHHLAAYRRRRAAVKLEHYLPRPDANTHFKEKELETR